MKPKKSRYDSSSDSEESDASLDSVNSSSESDSGSSTLARRSTKKKRKRAASSDSDSDSDQKRAKKRKHKKKKKKHSKKKRMAESGDESRSHGDATSVSDGEIPSKKKRKHKHKLKYKKGHSASLSGKEFPEKHDREDRRLQSVVKERAASAGGGSSHHSRTYYQKDYHRSPSLVVYEEPRQREQEVERFYRGSSKDRSKGEYREREDHRYEKSDPRYESRHPQEHYSRQRERYGHDYNGSEQYLQQRKPRNYEEYNNRNMKYEERGPPQDNSYKRSREDNVPLREHVPREYHQRYQQHDDRSDPRRRDHESRDYRERPGPPDPERYREREFPVKKEKYLEEPHTSDRRGDSRPVKLEREEKRSQVQVPRSGSPRSRDLSRSVKSPVVAAVAEPSLVRGARRGEERPDRSKERHSQTRSSPKRERKTRFNEGEDKDYSWGKTEVKQEGKDKAEKDKPNFGLSGKLAAETNTVNGIVLKYSEPLDAKQPKRRWRFYPFKGDKALPILYIHRQSCFILGREHKAVDIALEHPSVSKQHAALQYRATPFTRADGSQGRRVRPYIIDLDSANGTFVNNKKIEARRFVELLERDVVKFGFSLREYVLLHENSRDDAQDDDQDAPVANVTTTAQIKREKHAQQAVTEDGE